ncbi:MAG: SPOR domain-containing protein [Candidatus Pacebacteria bacterium]|nr:SPOR domain-containing protein [Candidatus Paceibacterota bacterium]
MSNELGHDNLDQDFNNWDEEENPPKKVSKVRLYSAIIIGLVVIGAIIAFLLRPNEQIPNETATINGDGSLFNNGAATNNGYGNDQTNNGVMNDSNGLPTQNMNQNNSMNQGENQGQISPENEVANQDKGVLNRMAPAELPTAPAAKLPVAQPPAGPAKVELKDKIPPAAAPAEVATPPKAAVKPAEVVTKPKTTPPAAAPKEEVMEPKAPEPLPELTAKSWRIQLVALSKRDRVEEEWAKLQSSFRLLGNLHHRIEITENATTKLPIYRLQAGPFKDEAAARIACQTLRDQSQSCTVVIPTK